MSLRCPNGHVSRAEDFCDTCGAPMAQVEAPAAPEAGEAGETGEAGASPAADDPGEAVRHAARYVAGQGNVSSARNARVRWAREQLTTLQDELIRDTELEDTFQDEFEETLAAVRDRLR